MKKYRPAPLTWMAYLGIAALIAWPTLELLGWPSVGRCTLVIGAICWLGITLRDMTAMRRAMKRDD